MSKRVWLILLSILIAIFSFALYSTYQVQKIEPDIEKELRAVATPNYLEKRIAIALSKDDVNEAMIYTNLAKYLHIKIDKSLLKQIEDKNSFLAKSWRNSKEFSKGFITGEADSAVGLSGSIASDMTLVGDVRDMYKEGSKLTTNQEYDKFTLGIATIGVALTVTTYLTAGSTSPLKVGASIMKVAKKSGKLSKSFAKFITSKVAKTVDFKLLKKIDFSSISKMKRSSKIFLKNIEFNHVEKLFAKVNKIRKNSSMIDSVKLMKYVDKPKDLNKVVKLSKKFNKNSVAVLKILGKGALRGGKVAVKYTTKFVAYLIALILSIISFIAILVSKYFAIKAVKRVLN